MHHEFDCQNSVNLEIKEKRLKMAVIKKRTTHIDSTHFHVAVTSLRIFTLDTVWYLSLFHNS